MQIISVLISDNSLAFKLWKGDNPMSHGKIIELVEQDPMEQFHDELQKNDIDMSECRIKLAVAHPEFLLKPIDTSDEHIRKSFTATSISWADKLIQIDAYPELRLKCIYNLKKDFIAGLEALNISFKTYHYIPVLIHGISQLENGGNKLYSAITDKRISLIYLQDQKIKYVNCYTIEYPQDMLYYMRLAAEQVNEGLNTTEINFIGRIKKDSELYKIVKPYAMKINFIGSADDEYIYRDLTWLKECV